MNTKTALAKGKIDGVEILHVSIEIGEVSLEPASLDLGSVTLSCDGREYRMDMVQSYTDEYEGYTIITVDLTTLDEDNIFEDCKFDLTKEDLFSPALKGTIYIGEDSSSVAVNAYESATLFIRDGYLTKAIELELE